VAVSDERKHMRLAIQEAVRSRGEDGRIHPFVGAVVVRNGQVLGSACRGEDMDHREHAEFAVLEKKLRRETLAGCTVYTTLEPCTTRKHPKFPAQTTSSRARSVAWSSECWTQINELPEKGF